MEIWIIGGVIVALMVYVSTKVKQSAAAAYDRETIETKNYAFIKPEGFICPTGRLMENSCFLHSQHFGDTEATESIYCAEALLVESSDSFDLLKSQAVSAQEVIIEEIGAKEFVVRVISVEDGVEFKTISKIKESSDGRVFDLRVRLLCSCLNEFQLKAEEIVSSFTTK